MPVRRKGVLMQSANTKKLGSDFPTELVDAFKSACAAKKTNPTAAVREFMEKYLGRKPAGNARKKASLPKS